LGDWLRITMAQDPTGHFTINGITASGHASTVYLIMRSVFTTFKSFV